MKILLVYATNSSGTQIAGEKIADVLTAAGHPIRMRRANETKPDDLRGYDLLIFGSCTWERITTEGKKLEGQLQEHFFKLAEALKGIKMPKQKFAVYALGDSSYQKFAGAADHLEKLVQSLGGTLIVPSLRVDGFYYDLERNTKTVEGWTKKIVAAL